MKKGMNYCISTAIVSFFPLISYLVSDTKEIGYNGYYIKWPIYFWVIGSCCVLFLVSGYCADLLEPQLSKKKIFAIRWGSWIVAACVDIVLWIVQL